MSLKNHEMTRYGLATILALAAVGLRFAFVPVMGLNIPYLTIYPAMMIAAVMLGSGPAVLATVIQNSQPRS